MSVGRAFIFGVDVEGPVESYVNGQVSRQWSNEWP
jgi:hypothetical protein